MPVNKNALLRYNILDKCFRNTGRKYYFGDLLDEVNRALHELYPGAGGIKTRQLREDIRFMKSEEGYAAPIETYREGRKAYYRYEDPEFSINNSPLNATEVEQLRSAITVLQRFSGAPQFGWVEELVPVLKDRLHLAGTEKQVMAYDTNIDYQGFDRIEPLFNAIVNRQVLEVTYEPFGRSPFTFFFHPYYLKQYNYRWFVFGFNEDNGHPEWNVPLDRIRELKQTGKEYRESDTDWEEYFYDIVGVTRPEGDPVEVVLEFTPGQAPYVETKPLHPSQKQERLDNGTLRVRLKVIPNYELETLILSFGEKVKVAGPELLKKRIRERLEEAAEGY